MQRQYLFNTDFSFSALPKEKSKENLYYKHKNGSLWLDDSIEWLKSLPANSVNMIFADPPYNIKKASWDSWSSEKQYIDWSLLWIKEAARILSPVGTLYICGFSEIIAGIKYMAMQYFYSCKWLIWHYRNKANLGSDWGRSHETILALRKSKNFIFNVDDVRIPYGAHTLKYPERNQGDTSQYSKGQAKKNDWIPNPLGAKPKDVIEIPTTCNGMKEKTPHPTQKPEELIRKLILASSNVGDIVLDPFCGSGTTPVCAEQLQRKWIACDKVEEYLGWAKDRIEAVDKSISIEEWKEYDLNNMKRRVSIR